MSIILIIIVLVLLLGGGGAYYGPRAGWGGPHYGGGLLGLVLLILLILWLTGNLGRLIGQADRLRHALERPLVRLIFVLRRDSDAVEGVVGWRAALTPERFSSCSVMQI